ALVERLPTERIHDLAVAAGDQAELRLGHEIADDAEKFVAAPAHADVAFAVHAEQAARSAQHEIAERVPVGVVVELEPIVVDELDAEAVAAVLLAQRSQQALFAHLAPIEQRAAVAAHPAQQRLALFQLHAFLPQLFEDVQKHLIPVLDLVADREL